MTLEATITNAAGVCSITALWIYVVNNVVAHRRFLTGIVARAFMLICFLCLSAAIVARGIEAARFPIANLYESLLLFCWGLLSAFFLFSRKDKMPQLGWLTALAVSTVFLYASWLPANQHEIQPLMPALLSYWRAIHVPPLIVSYAFLLLGGLLALLQLWKSGKQLSCLGGLAALLISIACIGMGAFGSISADTIRIVFWFGTSLSCLFMLIQSVREGKRTDPISELADSLDELSQKCISVAFPLLTFGIITGALWANHAWGTYWSWDPKESMSLATWLSYAAYLHLRARGNCSSCAISTCAVLGLLITILTYLGFNFLGFGGLHSYGQLS